MRILRRLVLLLVLLALTFAAAYLVAGRASGPVIALHHPELIGQTGTLDVTVDAPGARLEHLAVWLEQGERTLSVFTLDPLVERPPDPGDANRLRLSQPIGRQAVPELAAGRATVVVTASRPVFFGLREASSRATSEVEVRLDPPRLSVASMHHHVNVGGAELVLYRVTPPDAASGVRVGGLTYPGFPASGMGLTGDPALHLAFFAVLHDQEPGVPIELFGVDAAGNEGRATFDHRVFPRTFRRSRIALDDRFLGRIVPAILAQSPGHGLPDEASGDLLASFLHINGPMRHANNATIAGLAASTAGSMLWEGAFRPLGGSQVESGFADHRTYVYGGEEIDQQVHLGFDLARTVNVPILAANHGRVVLAGPLGIYGNTVVIDHGLGVQSLYAHLSSIEVQEGQDVARDDRLGLSGQTGLAGGDHLHFSMLVNGQFVNPIEWWDPKWMEDRVLRKLREAGAP